jgi:uncharacterized membrane protein YccC
MATTNPLSDLLPPTVRKYVYGVLFLAALVFGIWQASQGDWAVFAGSLIASLVYLLAASNTPAREGDPNLYDGHAA